MKAPRASGFHRDAHYPAGHWVYGARVETLHDRIVADLTRGMHPGDWNDPGLPLDVDLFELPEAELTRIPHVPGSLDDALDALEEDHQFLLRGGVFTEDLIQTWIDYKRREEADAVRLRPHPWEFALYYDA